jgi:hypothetical protein
VVTFLNADSHQEAKQLAQKHYDDLSWTISLRATDNSGPVHIEDVNDVTEGEKEDTDRQQGDPYPETYTAS